MLCVVLRQVVSPLLSLTSVMLARDRRVRSARVPITAKVVADFLSSVGVDRVLTVDLHAEQIQGFFDVPVDNVFGSPILLEDMLQLNPTTLSWFLRHRRRGSRSRYRQAAERYRYGYHRQTPSAR